MTPKYLIQAASFFLGLLISNVAQAADGAVLGFMAYSPDSHYFAFEQFGVQDGSGALYSELFVLDLEKNEWVGKSPFRVRQEDGSALAPVRARAMADAGPLLKQFDISEPVEFLVNNPATEVVTNRQHAQFDRYFLSSQQGSTEQDDGPMTETRYELSVESSAATLPASCPASDGAFYGFTLKLKSFKTGATSELYKDKEVPGSRRCPVSYDIAAVVSPMNYPKVERLVAIIGVYSLGFEGTDRRYVAVPFTLD
jgi:predicted secreted protein